MANKYFGEILRKLRNEKGYTQQQVADMLGLKNKSTLGSWEVGKSEPDGVTFLKLMKLYEVNDIYATFNEERPNSREQLHFTEDELKFIEAYKNADNETKQMIRRLLTYHDAYQQMVSEQDKAKTTNSVEDKPVDIFEGIPDTAEEFEKLYPPVGELKSDKDA